eukprot:2372032-Pyramimonas_sp.AAC.1
MNVLVESTEQHLEVPACLRKFYAFVADSTGSLNPGASQSCSRSLLEQMHPPAQRPPPRRSSQAFPARRECI